MHRSPPLARRLGQEGVEGRQRENGDLIAGRLSIEENASIKGRVELSEAVASASQRAGAETPATPGPSQS